MSHITTLAASSTTCETACSVAETACEVACTFELPWNQSACRSACGVAESGCKALCSATTKKTTKLLMQVNKDSKTNPTARHTMLAASSGCTTACSVAEQA